MRLRRLLFRLRPEEAVALAFVLPTTWLTIAAYLHARDTGVLGPRYPGGVVRPGQFARMRVAIDNKKGAILVPQRAVTELQGIYNVAVVKPDDTEPKNEFVQSDVPSPPGAPVSSLNPANQTHEPSWRR